MSDDGNVADVVNPLRESKEKDIEFSHLEDDQHEVVQIAATLIVLKCLKCNHVIRKMLLEIEGRPKENL